LDAEGENREVIGVAPLHDTDDYKLFGEEYSKNLTNATKIMNECDITQDIQTTVKQIISTVGLWQTISRHSSYNHRDVNCVGC
jgi:hypothetical protein